MQASTASGTVHRRSTHPVRRFTRESHSSPLYESTVSPTRHARHAGSSSGCFSVDVAWSRMEPQTSCPSSQARHSNMHIRIALLLLLLSCCKPQQVAVASDTSVDFAREVLPILSNKCFVCHGPDAKDDVDLRLDSFAAATADLGGYRAIDPAKLEASEILVRIYSRDDPMPPVDAEKQLSGAERDLLTRWIRQGGAYAKHWAFVPPQKHALDGNADDDQAIDAFIATQLHQNDVDFAPEADRGTLARRVALTLTGLPPEPDQLARYLGDDSADAYLRLVDELLASPRYGEHQARYWLDAVRYGDTHGLHLDNRRGIYPYRDWVVRAMNENLPLDQFITWQIAGDLLPNPTLEQQIATGYVRLNPSTGEGGAIADEFQAKNNFDRVETLGTVFLGMSLTCARCHTHKYDPITQTEYYRLLAFFNSTAEPALDGNSYTYGPVVRTPADQHAWQHWRQLTNERDRLLSEVATKLDEQQIAEAIGYAKARTSWTTSDWKASKPRKANAIASEDDAWGAAKGLPGVLSGRAARGKLPAAGQAIWITCRLEVPEDQTVWVTFSGAVGSQVYESGSDAPLATKQSAVTTETMPLAFKQGQHTLRFKILGGDGISALEVRIENPWDELATASRWSACDANSRLLILTDPSGAMSSLSLAASAEQLAGELTKVEATFTTSIVAEELAKPRPTRLLKRGEYNMPVGDPLEPGILEVMSPLPPDAPRNRLGLAQWLTAREHPLVARVLINRIWQRVFGNGLVRTPEDFGLQGQQPTHPQLLDWLAVELQESGWNLKHMLRMMVTSRTFRQSSAWRADLDDPENRLFARGPSYRLDAEVLRDLALWSSQLLDPQRGGEGVKPYQPSGMWMALAHPASNTKSYQRDEGRRLYRRSLYVYWKRTSPHPMMTLFDAPDRESSCVRRSRTNTALQSLGLLNETQRIEMARALAGRLLRERDTDDERLDRLFGLLACREPTAGERAACRKLLDQLYGRYSEDQDDAMSLLAVGDADRDDKLDAARQAAWTQVAVTFLASDIALLLY